MKSDPSAPAATRIARAMSRRCPRCGEPAFETYFTMKEDCSRCGLRFEREPGYWVGAMIINTTIVFATFLVSFGAGLLVTWPDVPWVGLLVFLVVVNGTVPVLLYPQSKTLWSALEMGWHPLEPAEIEAADRRAS
ncbi:MAG: DUF983 domain-containing protein [Actinobacteria bacterium]|nr:MAG: DUF983 domain-containing protein [Actinomycetota bacterium]